MNREAARQLAVILNAWADGERIEGMNPDEEWVSIAGEKFFPSMGIEYRIAPKPLECWVNVHEHSGTLSAVAYDSEQEAIEGGDFKLPPVHMREVTE